LRKHTFVVYLAVHVFDSLNCQSSRWFFWPTESHFFSDFFFGFFFFWFFLFALPCVWFLRSFCGFFSATFFFEFSRLLLDIMQSTLLFSSHTHTHFSRFSFLAMLFNFFLPAGFLPDGSWLLLCHLRF